LSITRKTGFITILAVLVVYVAIVLFSDLEKISQNFVQVKYEYLPAILTLYLLSIITKVFRQQLLYNKIGVRMNFKYNLMIFFSGLSMIVTSGGVGSLIKSQFLKDMHGHSRSKTMPVVLVERYHDLLSATSIIIVLSFFYEITGIRIFSIVISILLGFIYYLVRHERVFTFVTNKISKFRLLRKFANNIIESRESLQKLSDKKIVVVSWLISLVGLILEAVCVNLSFQAFNLNYSIANSTLIYFTSLIIGAISFIPGGVGLTEGSLIGFLLANKVNFSTSSSLVLFVRLTTIWFSTFIGFVFTRFLISKKNTTTV
jgi:glycosyltransferase 2 family protein